MANSALAKQGLGALLMAGTLISSAAVAQLPPSNFPQGQPGIPASGARVDPDNQAVIDALTKRLMLRPYHTLSPQEARRQPTFTDGVNDVLRQQGRPTTPPPGTTEQEIRVGNLPATVFKFQRAGESVCPLRG
jgi:hypothetical protein